MSHQNSNSVSPLAPTSQFYHGGYGRLFPNLPSWKPTKQQLNGRSLEKYCLDFARDQMVELLNNGTIVKPEDIASDDNTIKKLENKFGSKVPAGYTYFGQFIDHDITFDPTSSLQRKNDPQGLLNFRTPRLDLDNVYGRGPADQPYLYDPAHTDENGKQGKFLIGKVFDKAGKATCFPDLPRQTKPLCSKEKPSGSPVNYKAIIGDKRNDENSMVSQTQLAFLLAHNTLYDRAKALGMEDPFEAARKTLRWLYQWIVWNDYLQRITRPSIHSCALSLEKVCGGRKVWKCGLDDVYKWKNQPFMPVEFSVAAYRFGHSMVRNSYQTNHPHRGFGNFAPIFDNVGPSNPDDLRGFRPMLLQNTIQWDWFLNMNSGPGFPQRARNIDVKLSNALCFLHENAPAETFDNTLAARNILRGIQFELPSGTDVAKKFCIKPIHITDKEPNSLWYYILKEAEITSAKSKNGNRLGPVGSTIICATFAGLLKGDPNSYFNIEPCWTPDNDPLLRKGKDNKDSGDNWKFSSIIRLSGLPVNANDVTRVTNEGVTLPV